MEYMARQLVVTARYGSTCSRCHKLYPAGTHIMKYNKGWSHASCSWPTYDITSSSEVSSIFWKPQPLPITAGV